jgi:glycolate oxidase
VVVRPSTTEQVSRILALAQEHRIPVTTRGAGTGLSGGCIPTEESLLLSTERMKRIIEIDSENHVAVVEAGVTLFELDEATAAHGLRYPIQPGEASASLGGNIATNAGGMRAVKHGVTRHQVLGLEAVLPGGEVIQCGGKFVKVSSGYDLTQLIIGSEGTLCVVTKATLKLVPRMTQRLTLLAPFENAEDITRAVPKVVHSGVSPSLVEYLDWVGMGGAVRRGGADLSIPEEMKQKAKAYLLVVLEGNDSNRVQEDGESLGELLLGENALDVFFLSESEASKIIEGREGAFWSGKEAGMADQVDVVVPRASLSKYVESVQGIAQAHQTFITFTGHAGDGNIHLGIFQNDPKVFSDVMGEIYDLATKMGGMVSAEHGIGRAKKKYYQKLEDPVRLALMRKIKAAFDPENIMNPGVVFDGQTSA